MAGSGWQTVGMDRLTAADASFLYMENSVVHMHVTGVMILDPSSMQGGYKFATFRNHLISRIHLIAPFRRRLMTVPLGIDHPVWAEDPEFDIDQHLRREKLWAPGDRSQLATYVGNYASEPLDLSRPLWDMVVLEGLAGGLIAVVSQMHHVAVDGVSGTDMMAHLVDFSATPVPTEAPVDEFDPGAIPSPVRLAADAVVSRVSDPLRNLHAMRRAVTGAARLGQAALVGNRDGRALARPFDAPRTMFNQSLTERRSVAFGKAPLEDLRFVKSTFGTTVNDVFLAGCTQSLRSYIRAHGGTTDRPLLVSVPVSVHGQVADNRSANQVSNMFVRLPIDVADPVEQLRRIRLETRDAKEVHGAIGADMIGDVTELTPPAIFNLASRMYSRAGLAERLPPIHNLVISNVPGPPIPLYVAGARLVAVYPFGPLIEGSGLNITVLSNMGSMDIGVIGCPDIAPHIESIADGIVAGIERLRIAAVAERPTARTSVARAVAAKKPTGKKPAAKKPTAKKAAATKATGKPGSAANSATTTASSSKAPATRSTGQRSNRNNAGER